MNKKNKITLIIALVLLMVAAALMLNRTSGTLKSKDSSFAVEDTASVTRIFIADKNDNAVLLEKQDNGTWLINGTYIAHDVKVESLLKTLKDIRVRAPVPLVAREGVISRMATLGKKVEIYQIAPTINIFGWIQLFPRERNVRTYYVGDVTQDNMGTFMLMEGSDDPFIIFLPGFRGFVSSRYATVADEWREHTVFKAPIFEIDEVTVEWPMEPGQSYKVINMEDRTQLLIDLPSGDVIEGYDTSRMLSFMTSFRDVRFEALLNNAEPEFVDSVRSSTPLTILNLKKNDGTQREVAVHYKGSIAPYYDEEGYAMEPLDLDRAYAFINQGEDFVLIQYFVFDRVLRKQSFFTGEEQ